MFYECISLISLPNLSNWNLYYVISVDDMFQGCNSLISVFDFSKLQFCEFFENRNHNDIFNGCLNLLVKPAFIGHVKNGK